MTSDTAMYIGEAGKVLGGVQLIPGVTVANVPAAEALASDLWEPLSPVPAPATSAPTTSVYEGGELPTGAVAKPQIGALDGGTP